MICGACPYCDAHMMNPVADGPLPQFQKLECEECGETVWLKHSRAAPVAYTVEGFLAEYVVDEKRKYIRPRVPST